MIAGDFRVWDGVYTSFDEAPGSGPGFDGPIWRERSLAVARETIAKRAASETLDYALRQRNAIMPVVVAMLLSRQSTASILDFGGGLGAAFAVLASALDDGAKQVNYRIVEVDEICRAGQELFAGGDGPTFQPEWPGNTAFDLVHASSVIQYVEDWRGAVRRLAGFGAPYLVFGDLFIGGFATYVTLQNYYGSRIRHWFINADEFIAEVERCGFRLALRVPCDAKVLGIYGALPMNNFPEALRLPHTTNLLFSAPQDRS